LGESGKKKWMNLGAIEPLYVLDTNGLIWYLRDDPRLGISASQVIEAAEHGETRIAISSIVMAEPYYANKKWGFFEDFIAIIVGLARRLDAPLLPRRR
jgi:hypothetical protein